MLRRFIDQIKLRLNFFGKTMGIRSNSIPVSQSRHANNKYFNHNNFQTHKLSDEKLFPKNFPVPNKNF